MKLTAKTLLLVTPFNPALLQEDSCLSSFFYGNVRDGSVLNSVFIPTASCMGHFRSSLKTTELSGAPAPGRQLVWIEEESVEDSLRAQSLFHESPLDEITRRIALTAQGQRFDYAAQTPVSADTGSQSYDIHYRSSSGMLVSVDESTALTMDTLMPRFWKSAVLPPNPITHTPIPPAATQRVNHILLHLEFDPIVAQIVGNISIPQAKKDVRFLTGEDGKSGIVSRHSFTTGAITAAHWLKDTVEETGAHCRLMPFRTGFAPNVIWLVKAIVLTSFAHASIDSRYDAIEDTNSTVIISGHYDSRGSFGSLRAPGGDDDGSGTTGVLSIARAIGRKGVKFLNNVELAFFAGEEQGLLGSYAYARASFVIPVPLLLIRLLGELRAHDADIILMIQADMTAYRVPGEPLQLGLPAQCVHMADHAGTAHKIIELDHPK